MPVVTLNQSTSLQTANAIASTTNCAFTPPNAAASLQLIITVVRTAGSVSISFQGSIDGTTWFNLPDTLTQSFSASGTYVSDIGRRQTMILPKYCRVVQTPSSFTGTVALTQRTQGN